MLCVCRLFLPFLLCRLRPWSSRTTRRHHGDWNPYMRYALRPLNPVVLLGVTGKSTEAPKLQNKHSVMEWWKVRQGKGPSVEVSVLEMRVAPPRVPPF